MYKGNKIMALIPARGGSKGIPHKNIVNLCGRPLISYSIEVAKQSKYVDECFVSTEDAKIASIAELYGAEVIKRPSQLAGDRSKSIDVVLHALSIAGTDFSYIVLLQPTQPLRRAWHVDEAIEKMVDNEYSSLVSISPVKSHPVLIRSMSQDGKLFNLIKQSSTVRRQEFEKYYVVNGAIYINRTVDLTPQTSLNDNEYGYVMEERYDMDIDEPIDLSLCEVMMKNEDRDRDVPLCQED